MKKISLHLARPRELEYKNTRRSRGRTICLELFPKQLYEGSYNYEND